MQIMLEAFCFWEILNRIIPFEAVVIAVPIEKLMLHTVRPWRVGILWADSSTSQISRQNKQVTEIQGTDLHLLLALRTLFFPALHTLCKMHSAVAAS